MIYKIQNSKIMSLWHYNDVITNSFFNENNNFTQNFVPFELIFKYVYPTLLCISILKFFL